MHPVVCIPIYIFHADWPKRGMRHTSDARLYIPFIMDGWNGVNLSLRGQRMFLMGFLLIVLIVLHHLCFDSHSGHVI